MVSWIFFAILTAVLMLALFWGMRPGRKGSGNASEAALAVYKDQLDEIDRDVERGVIETEEAAAARNEISRRILAVDQGTGSKVPIGGSPLVRRLAQAFVLVAIPVMTVGLYLSEGSPNLPSMPHAERMARAVANNDFPALVKQVEEHLAAKPNDVQGWIVLAPAYSRLQRFSDAANAYAQIIRLKGASPDILADYGEALVHANQGIVSADARKAFDEALAMEKNNYKALFYKGLALLQEGKSNAAVGVWRGMLASAPADASWRAIVEHQIARAENDTSKVPTPSQDQMSAVKQLPADDQHTMINAMVDRLAARLASNGNDLDGWLRLARARSVLGEKDAAREALAKAESQFKDDTAALQRIGSLRKTLQLDTAAMDSAKVPAPDQSEMAAVKQLPANDQQAMIHAMVDRLAARLASNGNDLDGWLRLARARSVLGERDAAREALARAESQFKDDTAALQRIGSLRKTLQLD